jgi:hypothetical protein
MTWMRLGKAYWKQYKPTPPAKSSTVQLSIMDDGHRNVTEVQING